jgi:hypothetical protein
MDEGYSGQYLRKTLAYDRLWVLNRVHSGDDLTAEQIRTVGVGDRERIATGAVTRACPVT